MKLKVLRVVDFDGVERDFFAFDCEVSRSGGYFLYYVYGKCVDSFGRIVSCNIKCFVDRVDDPVPLQMSAVVRAMDFLDDLNARLAAVSDQEVEAV